MTERDRAAATLERGAAAAPARRAGRPRRELDLDPETEAWRFYHDNSIAQRPDAIDRAITGLARALVPPGLRVLEIGTAQGRLLAALRPETGVGVDISKRRIMDARSSFPGLRFVLADAQRLGALDDLGGPFDVVVMSQTLTEIADPIAALEALHAHIGPGARLIVFERSRSRTPRWAPAPTPVRAASLERLFALGGFEVITGDRSVAFGRRIRLPGWLGRRLARVPGVHRLAGFHAWVLRPAPHVFPAAAPLEATVIVTILDRRTVIDPLVEALRLAAGEHESLLVTTTATRAAVERALAARSASAARPLARLPLRIVDAREEDRFSAIRSGLEASRGEALVLLDGDAAEAPAAIPRFLEALRTHAGEVILADRLLLPPGRGGPKPLERLLGRHLARIFRLRLGQPLPDVNRSLKALRRRDLERILRYHVRIARRPRDDLDLLHAAGRLHLKLLAVPVRLDVPAPGRHRLARACQALRFHARALAPR